MSNKTHSEFVVKTDACIQGDFPNICAFRLINGGTLALVSFCGILLNIIVMFVIIGRKVNLSNQKYFMFNLAISNSLIAIVGMFRGLGIIDPSFVGFVGGEENGWCSAYLLFMMLVSYSNCPCMVALTFDRVVAISKPFMHRTFFTKWVCIGICVAVWLPQVFFYCWFMVTMFTNEETVSMEYYPNYHRCQNSYKNPWLRTVRFVALVWAPFSLIILMYSIIIYKVIRSGAKTRRLLAISTVIIVSGIICWFPSIISSIFSIPMNYKVAQVLTVSLFYMSSSTDPLVYVLLMPAVKKYLITKFVKCEEPPPISSSSGRPSQTSSVVTAGPQISTVSTVQPRTSRVSTVSTVQPRTSRVSTVSTVQPRTSRVSTGSRK